MSLQQAFLAVPVPLIDPQRNRTAMHLQMVGYLSGRVSCHTHQNPLGCAGPPAALYPSVLGVEVPAVSKWLSSYLAQMLDAYRPSLLIFQMMSNYLCAPI